MKSVHDFKEIDQYNAYLRTYFAAMAMQGWIASQHEGFTIESKKRIAKRAVQCADELLKQLEQ